MSYMKYASELDRSHFA